jgi:hypothetical protein
MPITLHDGQVPNGWYRYTACKQIGRAVMFETFRGNAAAARRFVISRSGYESSLSVRFMRTEPDPTRPRARTCRAMA